MKVRINNKDVIGNSFVWDGCHKIYIIEDEEDLKMMQDFGYNEFYDINKIVEIWQQSCGLRFISNGKLDKEYVRQCEDAKFEFID